MAEESDAVGGSSISRELSRAIYEDAVSAYHDTGHPCHTFRSLQPGVPDEDWQLPEPFNGAAARAGIVFLGLNPSYDPNEAVPRIGAQFDEWDRFYRTRFETAVDRWHKLYRRYQRVGELATSSDFRLGADAVVLELIRYRSAGGAGCKDRAVLNHELPITSRLLEELAPRVVVANGGAALWAVQQLWPALQQQIPVGTGLLEIEFRRFTVDMPWGRISVVPTRHLSAAFGFRLSLLEALAASVACSLQPDTPQ
jgi:hypothetical protein